MGVVKDLLKALVRAALYALFSWMVTKGWISQEQADSWLDPMVLQVVGVVGFVAVYLWSARDKIKSWLFGKFALEAPANTTPREIKTEIKHLSVGEQVREVLSTAPPDGATKEN